MTLKEVLDTISGNTPVVIYVNNDTVFDGKMCETKKSYWDENVAKYHEAEIIRLNTIDGKITIGCGM